ncbi:hypothetical protein KJ359_004924 [Pestalotiopsis sp. 9143b]|nr:hypothetical protein KJ359_004924 [Pestalotiopsis sp. 9143b]
MANFRNIVVLAALSCLPRGLAWYRELPSCLDEFQPFVQVGCFDNGEPGGQEALSVKTELSVTGMTVETCVAECKGNGFRYAGLAWYGNCYCGQTVDTAMLDAGQCSLPCDGNKTEVCGGDTAVNVYQDPTFLPVADATVDEYVALGCYTDGSSLGKALFYQQAMADTSAVTTEACLTRCLAGGFPFAGTEYARECYCGVVLGNDTAAVDAAECAMPCTGNSSQVCGGPDRLSLYVARDLQSLEPCGYEDVPGGNSSTTSSSAYATASSSSSEVSSPSSSLQTSTPASVTTTAYPSSYSASPSSSTVPIPPASTTSSSPSSTYSATLTTSVTKSGSSSSTTSSAALCTATTITPPTCEYTCGKWCSSPLPDWTDGAGCLTAWSSCAIQTAACFAGAGWPDAMDCFGFLEWCGSVQAYCGGTCKGSKCGKSDCLAKNPPQGGQKPSSTSMSEYPCPTTVTSSTTSKASSTPVTSYPVPTPTGACKQPSNPWYNYAPGSPVGGIALPAMTCNNLAAQHAAGAVLKLYTDSDSRKCASYPRSGCGMACADACRAQYDQCQGTYAAGCLVNGWAGGKSYGGSGDRFGLESYDSASTRCMQQYLDCLSVNLGISAQGKCVKFGDGW